jgi:hypothetical protein
MRGGAGLVLVLVLVAVLLLAGGAEVVDQVVGKIVNGPRVGPATRLRADGLVDGDPTALAAAAGLDLKTYALARALVSEHGNDPDVYLIAIGWAIRNKAAERGVSLFELLTDGKGVAGDWLFGEQKAAAGTKYAATGQDPAQRHATIASFVLSSSSDPTGGATHFFSPKAQDSLAAKAETDPQYAKYKDKPAVVINESWTAPGGLYPSGAVPVVPPGIDGYRLTLYRRA